MNITTTVHEFQITDEDETNRTWKCTCGFWCTVETIDAPDYHTPMPDRFAGHLAQAEAVESGKAWEDLPNHYDFELFHRKSWIDGHAGQIVLWATWMGGWREVRTFALDYDGIQAAATYCDSRRRRAYWRSPILGTQRISGNELKRMAQNWI